MAARTLVLGIPLPHVSFDNYSFLSAPSFADYSRLIVETAAVSRAVDDVIQGHADHHTFAGQPIANAPTSPRSFSLAEILAMRRRESEWALARGGVIVCLAHPDVPHTGAEGIAEWRRYDWLPEPKGFSYPVDLAPAFGRPGVVLQDEGHAFAPYVQALAERLAYRVQVNEQAPALKRPGTVFIRSSGGLAVGAELPVLDGRVIILPPLLRPENDRAFVAETLFQCLERWQNRASETAQTLRKEVP